MAMYSLDITESYERFICLESAVGLHHYLSFPDLELWKNEKLTIMLENIEVNMCEEPWHSPIVSKNGNSIIVPSLNKVDIDEPGCIFTVVLRKAKVVVGAKCILLRFDNGGNVYFHSQGSSFDIGDKYIFLAGKSSDYIDSMIWLNIVFSGSVFFEFDESDIIIQSIELDNNITQGSAKTINNTQGLFIKLKGRVFDPSKLNGVYSPLQDYKYLSPYFHCDENNNIAIKPYNAEE